MVTRQPGALFRVVLGALLLAPAIAWSQEMGSIRGVIYDQDFDVPMSDAQVLVVETGQKAETTDEGNYVLREVAPGKYTLVFSKPGYNRQVKTDVLVSAGRMTEVNTSLVGEFAEMDEFVAEEMNVGGAEAELLDIRAKSPGLMDSVSVEFMSRAGASDAADALTLVSGATVQEGKFAVIRGLPDRYVVSQMNGVRLPTADADKRAVELDQFPSDVIHSVQVTKTFTPDQQGDASGGAVNIILKGIPDRNVFKFSLGTEVNTQTFLEDDFLTYRGGGVNCIGVDDGPRDIQWDRLGKDWGGAVGVERDHAPWNYDWSVAAGGRHEFETGLTVGGFATFYYERDSSFFDDGVDDAYWVEDPGGRMTPQFGNPDTPQGRDFKTSLFDITQGSQSVKWGGLGTVGAKTENHEFALVYMYTRVAEDKATLAEDTRGKRTLHEFWPQFYGPEYANYDPNDPTHPGNADDPDAAPWLRTETLDYSERTTQTIQFSGRHTLRMPAFEVEHVFKTLYPEVDWTVSTSSAGMVEPDKRLLGTQWRASALDPGIPWLGIPPSLTPAEHRKFKPSANFTMGNLQRTWKEITEESNQLSLNVKVPFEQWGGEEGYAKVGVFYDNVDREYDQESFSNFGDLNLGTPNSYQAGWEQYWSEVFPGQGHRLGAAQIDVDYTGRQRISAWYYMVDLPLSGFFKVIGGVRHESTDLSIENEPEPFVTWIPPDADASQDLDPPNAADVTYKQDDTLPSVGFVFEPFKEIAFRGSFSETVARQTFKELSPIQQMEYLGGDVFIGNPRLRMSELKNYDLRLDYTPYKGGLVSVSWFHKKIKDPIEYVQKVADFTFTTPVNYPEGELTGYEFEIRQRMGEYWEQLDGLTLGANATFIDSEVTLTPEEITAFNQPNLRAPMTTRDMTNAPEHLYNLSATYDLPKHGTKFGLFYTVRGDTLVAGAGQSSGMLVPSIYERQYGTLNFTASQKLGEHATLSFKAKNLLDPEIKTVYRSRYIDGDVTRTSYRKGMSFSLSLSMEW